MATGTEGSSYKRMTGGAWGYEGAVTPPGSTGLSYRALHLAPALTLKPNAVSALQCTPGNLATPKPAPTGHMASDLGVRRACAGFGQSLATAQERVRFPGAAGRKTPEFPRAL